VQSVCVAVAKPEGKMSMFRALIVDDDRDLRELMALRLGQLDVEVAQAANGQKALKALCEASAEEQPFGVILLDVAMPVIDGWQVLEALKANPLWQNTPIIMVTGIATSAEEITRMSNYGVLYTDKGSDCVQFVSSMVGRLMEEQPSEVG
jgi:CheY-like chemotaxis protein